MLRTRLTERLGIEHPVVLGGMASGTNPELVAAVSEAGGLGSLGATGLAPEQLRDAIRAIRRLTSRPFAINFLVFAAPLSALETALDEGVPILSTAWGDASAWIARARAAGIPTLHMVPSVEEAVKAKAWGADIIVAQGTEGGGHVGQVATLPLVPGVVDAVAPLPVVAAGGIADGRGLAAALALGAEGALLGTRFLATEEAPVPGSHKRAIVGAAATDTLFTQIPDIANQQNWPGAWGRVIRNQAVDAWRGREEELRRAPEPVAAAFDAARDADDPAGMILWAGQSSGLIGEILPAGEVVRRLVAEAEAILRERLPRFLG